MKKEANKILLNFIAEVQQKSTSDKRDLVVHLCELNHAHPEVHSLVNHHLSSLIQDTLYDWSKCEPTSIISHRWEALYGGSERQDLALGIALELDPDDQVVVTRKSKWIVHKLEFMTHHLDENTLLGDLAEANSYLTELRPLVPRISDNELKKLMESELAYYVQLFQLWEDYEADGADRSFLEWAKQEANFDW